LNINSFIPSKLYFIVTLLFLTFALLQTRAIVVIYYQGKSGQHRVTHRWRAGVSSNRNRESATENNYLERGKGENVR